MEENFRVTKAQTHQHTLVLSKHVHTAVHGKSFFGRINTFLAINITKIVGSMWCAYVFMVLAFISLPAAIRTNDPLIIVAWIAQTFLQLVLLPIIIVGQNVASAASDERAKHDHETLMAIHTITSAIYEINKQQNEILKLLKEKK